MLDTTNHSWSSSHCFIIRHHFFVLDPGSSLQMPIEHFHMHVLLSGETFVFYLDLLLISPPLFSAGDMPLSQSLRDTSTRHHALFPLHSLSHLISHGVSFFGMTLSSSSHGYQPSTDSLFLSACHSFLDSIYLQVKPHHTFWPDYLTI